MRHEVVDDLLDDAVGELDGQFVGMNCRYGAVAEYRVRDLITDRVLADIGGGGRRG
jgi:hypothetical protein